MGTSRAAFLNDAVTCGCSCSCLSYRTCLYGGSVAIFDMKQGAKGCETSIFGSVLEIAWLWIEDFELEIFDFRLANWR
jgi:hypothetical protein